MIIPHCSEPFQHSEKVTLANRERDCTAQNPELGTYSNRSQHLIVTVERKNGSKDAVDTANSYKIECFFFFSKGALNMPQSSEEHVAEPRDNKALS
ncbi:hypothetical protein JZ751_026684 [Albula glossodonta]|uniref:Uncharacterized protein n=1 Tax=Albula glossodonta TaxID=121402 RepID=A0A8T2PE38_9TELE|nr:hypothetical protein JZ751_026684 [Albula glossodonta]